MADLREQLTTEFSALHNGFKQKAESKLVHLDETTVSHADILDQLLLSYKSEVATIGANYPNLVLFNGKISDIDVRMAQMQISHDQKSERMEQTINDQKLDLILQLDQLERKIKNDMRA